MFSVNDTRIYSAGKVWHAEKFRMLRDVKGMNIISSWIDFGPQAFGDGRVWEHCLRDIQRCDYLVMYCEPDDVLVGGLIEIGHAMALNKPVYCIGKGKTFTPSANSDVAVTHHPLWQFTPTLSTLESGFRWAERHYSGVYGPSDVSDLHYLNKKAA